MVIFMKKIISIFAILALMVSIAVPVSAVSKPKAVRLKKPANTAAGIKLNWTSSKNADKYYVYRKTPKVKYKKIATVKTTSYIHKGAVSGNKYTYKIYAVNTKGKSKPSNQKSITRVGTPNANVSNAASAIKVSWKKIRKATSYAVLYKKTTEKKYKVLYRGKKCSCYFYNLQLGYKYNFKVRAKIKKCLGAYCAAKTGFFLYRPSISAEEREDMKGIYLDWSPVSYAKGYIIYRSPKYSNSYKRIKKFYTDTTLYLDTDVKSINSYKYYVVAYTDGGFKSAKSNITSEIYGYIENFSTPLTLAIKKGQVYKDIYNKINEYMAVPLITWESLKPSVAKVTVQGVITGVKKGSATLKATIDPELFSLFGHSEIKTAKTVTINVTVK